MQRQESNAYSRDPSPPTRLEKQPYYGPGPGGTCQCPVEKFTMAQCICQQRKMLTATIHAIMPDMGPLLPQTQQTSIKKKVDEASQTKETRLITAMDLESAIDTVSGRLSYDNVPTQGTRTPQTTVTPDRSDKVEFSVRGRQNTTYDTDEDNTKMWRKRRKESRTMAVESYDDLMCQDHCNKKAMKKRRKQMRKRGQSDSSKSSNGCRRRRGRRNRTAASPESDTSTTNEQKYKKRNKKSKTPKSTDSSMMSSTYFDDIICREPCNKKAIKKRQKQWRKEEKRRKKGRQTNAYVEDTYDDRKCKDVCNDKVWKKRKRSGKKCVIM